MQDILISSRHIRYLYENNSHIRIQWSETKVSNWPHRR